MAVGNWNKSNTIMNMSYSSDVTTLGYHFTNISNKAATETRSSVVARMRATAQDAYQRDLSLDKRIQFVQQHLLAKIWYVTQIFSPPTDAIRRINRAIAWFIWQGEIFRVPLSTLQREKDDGGCKNVQRRGQMQSTFHAQTTEATPARRDKYSWLAKVLEVKHNTWKPTISCGNNGEDGISSNLCNRCCIRPETKENWNDKAHKKRIYDKLKALAIAITSPTEMRTEYQYPETEWKIIWKNLAITLIMGEDKANW